MSLWEYLLGLLSLKKTISTDNFARKALITWTRGKMPAFSFINWARIRRHPVDPAQAVILLGQWTRGTADKTRSYSGSCPVVAPSACWIAPATCAGLLRRAHVLGGLLGATLATVGSPVHALAVGKRCLKQKCSVRETHPDQQGVTMGGSPGLVVMCEDSCLKGRGFESQCHILDGHFFTLICSKNCIVCLKRPKINKKRGRGWPI